MRWLRRRRTAILLGVVVLGIGIGVGIGIAAATEEDEPKSPQVLNRPTDARRVRPLRPGPEPGFRTRFRREEHTKER